MHDTGNGAPEADPVSVLEPGMRAPDITLVESNSGKRISLTDLQGEPVVLTFFSEPWDPARTEYISRYNELLEDLNASGGAGHLLQVTRDGNWHRATFTEEATDIRVLTDTHTDKDAARRYGVAGRQAVFVIGGDGTIRWRFVAPSGVYPAPEAVKAALVEALAPTAATRNLTFTRRDLLATALAAAFALTLPFSTERRAEAASTSSAPAGTLPITLLVNGEKHTLNLDPRVTLLDALREYIGLTGSKKGCDHGQCGACTVHIEGRRVNSCLTLAVASQKKPITTIEGLAQGDKLHPLQEAFIKHDGFQCGYCTPGQIMSAVALLKEGHAHTVADVRELMSGNICRCGAYPNIIDAIEEVRTGAATASEGRTQNDASV